MKNTFIGYVRCSTDKQDLSIQQQTLMQLGVDSDRIYADFGFAGTNRERPGLAQALAALREGDTLVIAKLDRLARSVYDLIEIARELETKGVKLSISGAIYDPADPMSKLFFMTLAMVAEFERDLISARTKEGMVKARALGRLIGKKPKLTELQQKELVKMYENGKHTITDLAELFSVSRPTIHRTLKRNGIDP